MDRIGIAVLGAGYWGPNLVRNVALSTETELKWVCDLDLARAEQLAGTYAAAGQPPTSSEVLNDPDVDAVAIATPASTHAALAHPVSARRQARADREAVGRIGRGRRGDAGSCGARSSAC